MRKSEVKETINKNSRSYWQNLILEWVHDETDRQILTKFLLDGWTLEEIGKEVNMEYQNLYRRYKKAINQLLKHIEV